MEVINEKIDVSINESNIGRCHRTGKKDQKNAKPRSVILKFARYNICRQLFSRKKKLNGLRVSITENLTPLRMAELTTAWQEFGFYNVRTIDGMICFLTKGSRNPKSYYSQKFGSCGSYADGFLVVFVHLFNFVVGFF